MGGKFSLPSAVEFKQKDIFGAKVGGAIWLKFIFINLRVDFRLKVAIPSRILEGAFFVESLIFLSLNVTFSSIFYFVWFSNELIL